MLGSVNELPDLNVPLAYKHDDDEHLGGGYCADLTGEDDLARWTEILIQQHTAFTDLAAKARSSLDESGTGYEVTRPLLFLAHHVCEVAIKVGLVAAVPDQALVPVRSESVWARLWRSVFKRDGAAATGPESGIRGHDLPRLWKRLVKAGGVADLRAHEVDWCDRFVREMSRLTKHGFEGRYADEKRTEEDWCCFNLDHLEVCVTTLVVLMLALTETEESGVVAVKLEP